MSRSQAGKAKSEGVESGVPDMCLAWPGTWDRRPHGSMYIEMKRKGGRVSPEQHAWHARLRDAGYLVQVCWSCEEAWDAIKLYLSIKDL